ncbi:MAG: response regulator transcription factor [Pseudonocardiaceae bacterium]
MSSDRKLGRTSRAQRGSFFPNRDLAATGRHRPRCGPRGGHAAPRCVGAGYPEADLGGVSAAREITRDAPAVAVLMLTMFNDDELVFAAMRAGARGYVLKGAAQEEIIRASSGRRDLLAG